MVHMFPKVDSASIETESERLLYDAFIEQLSDDYFCFHSYPWLRPNRDLTLREGEADFVILHQTLGMLIVEAKGGLIDYQAPLWKRKIGRKWEVIKDPLEQAKRNMHEFRKIIEEGTDGDVLSSHFTYGFCAAFPTHDYNGRTPHNADPAVVISKSDMGIISDKIEAAFVSWGGGKSPLDSRRFSKLVNALLPKFKLFRSVSVDFKADLRQIRELTDGQIEFFRHVTSDRVYVDGVAGSGKTLLAMDRAKEFARTKKTLLVCYNKELAQWWRELYFGDQEQVSGTVPDGKSGLLSIYWFHSLASRVANSAEVPFDVPSSRDAQKTFWRDEAPNLIEQSVMVLSDDSEFRFDAIVLDEGQDFHSTWWDCLNYCLLKKGDKGIFYAFGDPTQSLWEWSAGKPDLPFPTTLSFDQNCRNTHAIATSSAKIAKIEAKVLNRSPQGLKPKISFPPSPESGKGIVIRSVEELIDQHKVSPSRIVLIGTRSLKNGPLANTGQIAGINLTPLAAEWRKGNGLLVTTARAFKGLEADAVVIYDVGELDGYFTETDLYVACTRGITYLHLIVHHKATAKRIDDAINAGWLEACGG